MYILIYGTDNVKKDRIKWEQMQRYKRPFYHMIAHECNKVKQKGKIPAWQQLRKRGLKNMAILL